MKRVLGILAVAGALTLVSTAALAQDYRHGGSRYGSGYKYGGYGSYGSGYRGGYGGGGYGGYGGYGYNGPVYHAPSVHYDRVYHPERTHWTPNRGWHTHGHFDLVPHYTPGHYDHQHGNHIHGNPYYHNH